MSNKKSFTSLEHSSLLLQTIYLSEKFSDISLIAEDSQKRIKAHKLILSAGSEYFQLMFSSAFKEATDNEIKIKDVSFLTLEALIRFLYSGVIEIRSDSVAEMLNSSHLLKLNEVEDFCWKYLTEKIEPNNCIGIYLLASERYDCQWVKEETLKYVSKFFVEVSQHDEFLNLKIDQLKQILERNCLRVNSEEDVYKALLLWLDYDEPKRKMFFSQLLKCIRLPLLSSKFILKHVQPRCKDFESFAVITDALKWHLVPEERDLIVNLNPSPRRTLHGKVLLMSCVNNHIRIHAYCPRANFFDRDVINEAIPYQNINSCTLWGNSVVLMTTDGTVAMMELDSLTWTNLETLEKMPVSPVTCIFNGSLVVQGGRYKSEGKSFYNKFLRIFDLTSESWTNLEGLGKAREDVGAVTFQGELFVIGGWYGKPQNYVEYYKPEENSWANEDNIIHARLSPELVVHNNFIYMFGGKTDHKPESFVPQIEKYCPYEQCWTEVGEMSDYGLVGVKVTTFEEKIYVLKICKQMMSFSEFVPETNIFRHITQFDHAEDSSWISNIMSLGTIDKFDI